MKSFFYIFLSLIFACQSKQDITDIDDVIERAYKLFIPLGGNTFNTSQVDPIELKAQGLSSWRGVAQEATIFVYSNRSVLTDLSLLTSRHQHRARYQITVNQTKIEVDTPVHSDQILLGVHQLQEGYNSIRLQGLETSISFPEVRTLKVASDEILELHYVKENQNQRFYWGRRGASVHLRYVLPSAPIKWMFSEIEIPLDHDPIGMFAMANGFKEGYFGLQVNSENERRILFSVWSPYQTQDPNLIPNDLKVRLIKMGIDVQVQEFGHEGSGAQSYLIFPWKSGVRYQFLNSIEPDGNETIYSGYFKDPEQGQWRLIARFIRPNTSTWYQQPHSFLENFNPEFGHQERSVYYRKLWMRDVHQTWHKLNQATFTTDEIGKLGYRVDFQGGSILDAFFLKHCGFFTNQFTSQTKIYTLFKVDQEMPPDLDFEAIQQL